MSKRYQVFLSSTFVDLQEERRKIFNALMKMDCIPAGMELFPAADEEQFNFIKKIIDDCDYYVLVVGGRYGTPSETGLSYTEMEYDYAKSAGVQVLAFLPKSPGEIKASKTETGEAGRKKLEDFKTKVATSRLVDFWEGPDDLTSKVLLALLQTIKTYPAVGWVRANKVSNEGLLLDLNQLRKENEDLRLKQASLESSVFDEISDLADFSERFSFEISYKTVDSFGTEKMSKSATFLTWKEIFGAMALALENGLTNDELSRRIGRLALKNLSSPPAQIVDVALLHKYELETIIIQMRALGFMESGGENWWLTKLGKQAMLSLLAVKKSK